MRVTTEDQIIVNNIMEKMDIQRTVPEKLNSLSDTSAVTQVDLFLLDYQKTENTLRECRESLNQRRV